MYTIKLRHFRRGAYGKTLYQYQTRVTAVNFARGYQRALLDVGRSDLFVSVHDEGGTKIYECRE